MLRKLELNPTAEKLIDVTVELVDRQGGLQGVNLRKIARVAGCAHTNVYNYFENFEGLLWTALERILKLWGEYVREHQRIGLVPEEEFAEFIAVQVDFAMEHSGWYQFIWLEPFTGTPPPQIYERFRSLRANFAALIMKATGNVVTQEQVYKVEEILHGYCHGDLCKLLTARTFVPDRAAHKRRIVTNCRTLLKLLSRSL